MASNTQKRNGTLNAYKPDAGGSTLSSLPVIGVVKNNVDPTHSGQIQVYIAALGGNSPDDSKFWRTVRYMSPFYGVSSYGYGPRDGPDKSGDGKFVGNPQSYGFWASAPDIGTEVICIFVNGIADQGYYIGCIPQTGLLQMTPAIGSSNIVVPNEAEAATYGSADKLPTSEVNYSNPTLRKNPEISNAPKPVHSYQTSILFNQGIIRDPVRGVISSSAQRESPSRVFGMSTPGGIIPKGGKQVGRTGGHTFVMDDGTLNGDDRLMRFRSSEGHQITMSDSGETIFIIHSSGKSWIEMGKEGTIDIFSENSFNVGTRGHMNFHADMDININAGESLNISAKNIHTESTEAYTQRVGTSFSQYTVGQYTLKVGSSIAVGSGSSIGVTSSGDTSIVGSKINLNSGGSVQPPSVEPITQQAHNKPTYSESAGWLSIGQTSLNSIVTRAPAHHPWDSAGKGIDGVTVKNVSTPQSNTITPATQIANASTPATPVTPVTPAAIAAVPAMPGSPGKSTFLDPATKGALVAQIAATAQGSTAEVNAANGVLNTASGITSAIIEAANSMKPDAAQQAQALMAIGMPMAKALASISTGTGPLPTTAAMIGNVPAQGVATEQTLVASAGALTANGTLTGNESPAQAGGVIMAGVTKGVTPVTNFVKTGVTSVAGLGNDIAGGKFAAGLSDSMSFSGLKDSLSGLSSGIGSGLQGAMSTAFSVVESSFGVLKAGVANVLGPKKDIANIEPSDTAKAATAYDAAQAEVTSAETAYYIAKKEYRDNSSQENNNKLNAAEEAWAHARQKSAQASASFLKAGASSATSTVSGLFDSGKSSLNTGLNALPGGPGVLQPVTNMEPSNTNQSGTTMGIVNSVLGKVGGIATSAFSLAGDIIGKTKDMLSGAMSKVGSPDDSIKSGAAGLSGQTSTSLSSIGSSVGGLRPASSAVNTSPDSAIMMAKVGQLLGDPIIPTPGSRTVAVPEESPESIRNKMKAYNRVAEATAKVKQTSIILGLTQELINANPDNAGNLNNNLKEQTAAFEAAQVELIAANKAYASVVNA